MKTMNRFLLIAGIMVCTCIISVAQNSTSEQQLRTLLDEFLAKVDQEQMHDRFWAEELIYTGSSGRRIGKKDIMAGFQNPPSDETPTTTYSAEDVQIRVIDDVAILAFKLVAKDITAEGTTTSSYYNSGTLQKQNGEWKVILWQATKIPADK